MAGRFPFKTLSKYPHMKPEDVAVWERFIIKNPAFFDTVDYDVTVGNGAEIPEQTPENLARMQTKLTQKKIDVIGYAGDVVYIIEVGPVADMRKLGQILTYTDLFQADNPNVLNPVSMVLCGQIERELEPMFEKYGVVVETA